MPFVERKTIPSEAAALLGGGLAAASGVDGRSLWDGAEYRPSAEGSVTLHSSRIAAPLEQATKRRLCANAECAGGWTMPWRSRFRPVFEEQWGCCGRCVLALARAAAKREQADISELAGGAPHRHRVPLGLLMLAHGWITHPQLGRALEAQRESGTGRIGEWLIRQCGVAPEQVMRGLSLQWSCPVLSTEGFSPDHMSLVMPKIFVDRFGLLPLRVAGSKLLYLGFEQRLDASVAFAMERMTDLRVECGLVEEAQFQAARSRLLGCKGVEAKHETAADQDVMAARMTAILEQKQPVASRFVRMHHFYWMRIWLERGAIGKIGSLPRTGEDVIDYVFTIGGKQ